MEGPVPAQGSPALKSVSGRNHTELRFAGRLALLLPPPPGHTAQPPSPVRPAGSQAACGRATAQGEHIELGMLYDCRSDALIPASELRLVLVGKTGAGKSATGNSILGAEEFRSLISPSSVTAQCEKRDVEIGGRRIVVVDTPGFFDTSASAEETAREVKTCVKHLYPGPHAIIQVVQLGRFSEQEKEVARIIQSIFTLQAKNYMILLFTRKDDLGENSLGNFLLEGDKLLQAQVAQCGGRCLVFNNRATGREREEQVQELLRMVDGLVARNRRAPHYTERMLAEDREQARRQGEELLGAFREMLATQKREILEQMARERPPPSTDCTIL